MKQKPIQKNTQGFTLIEALVAVFIFSSAVVFLITMTGRGLLALNASEKQTTAYFLSQEGIEIIQNLRDQAFLESNPNWLGNINASCIDTATDCGFNIDINNQTTSGVVCSGANCDISMDSNNPPKFLYGGPNATPFFRRIKLQEQDLNGDGIDDALEVTSTVSWQQGTFTRNVILIKILREWVITGQNTSLAPTSPLAPLSAPPSSLQPTIILNP